MKNLEFRILLFFLLAPAAFGVGTFTYTESTNKIVVTAGTSGTPATFNDMYTADQAGTATDLLLAEAGTSAPGNSLTYAIRPTHDKALIIKCIVAAKTAEADYIFITGTDAWGAAQTESLDVTAGNGTYTTTKRFASASEFDCSDNAAGGGTVWADGTIQVTQDIWGVVWEFTTDAQYQIDCLVDFGDNSTSTYFESESEVVLWSSGNYWFTRGQATLELGDLDGDWGIQGSTWLFTLTASTTITEASSTFKIYDSTLRGINNGAVYWLLMSAGTQDFRNSTFADDSSKTQYFWGTSTSAKRCYFSNPRSLQMGTPVAFESIHIHSGTEGVRGNQTFIATKPLISSTVTEYRTIAAITITAQDPITNVGLVYCSHATSKIIEQYTCNIHVTDKEGSNLSGVTVKCVETGGTTEFSVSTAADGTITEQTIDYKKWEGTSETETAYSPHEFTFTKAGFEPYIIKNVTVDDPIVWEIELDGATGAWEVTYR